jgi:beta-lactamase regulating signal transducer with metallopeptidase domain
MTALLLVKASLLLSVTLLAMVGLRRAPAASRHRLWTFAFAALLALPALPFVLPAIDVPLPSALTAPQPRLGGASEPSASPVPGDPVTSDPLAIERATPRPENAARRTAARQAVVDMPPQPSSSSNAETAARRTPADWAAALLFAVWLTGAGLAAGALVLSLLRVQRLSRAARDVADPAWRQAADALGGRLALSRPVRLLESADVSTPMAAGILRPTIFLPAAASAWSAECRDIVLAHEIAHLAARDPLRHVTARLAISCYWFHPLAWMAARQGMLAREQACDEAVLALGARPSTYARVLLELAGSLREPMAAYGALPMVQRSLLETRLMSILNDSRPAMARRSLTPVAVIALLTCTLAAARPGSPTTSNVGTRAGEASPLPAPSSPATTTAVTSTEVREAAAPRVSRRGGAQRGADRACASNRSGSYNGDRVIQQTFGDLHVCMTAEGLRDDDWRLRPSQWIGAARRVVLESRRGDSVQRLEVQRGGNAQTSWQVGGAARTFDAAAQEWRDRTLAALDTSWEISALRGQVSSLRGEISSVRGEVSSMRGRASSVRGDESSLRGQISSIHGHVSSLRGQISSERGQISALQSAASIDDPVIRERVAARVAKHNEEIARIEREIRDYGADARVAAVEKQIAALDAAGKVAAIETQIGAFDLQSRIAAVERRIAELDVPGKVAAIEGRIEALDADRRVRQLEERRDGEVRQIERAIAALR